LYATLNVERLFYEPPTYDDSPSCCAKTIITRKSMRCHTRKLKLDRCASSTRTPDVGDQSMVAISCVSLTYNMTSSEWSRTVTVWCSS